MLFSYLHFVLSYLLIAISGGIQFAAAQLPLLQLFDCGMSISDLIFKNESEANGLESGETKKCQKLQSAKSLPIYQKLIIKHGCLKKLSLWGCSGLDVRQNPEKIFAPSIPVCEHFWFVDIKRRPYIWTAQSLMIWTLIYVQI